ncbi:MAG TPA: type II toxin-antitoxin system VapC family toxin [Acidimicrobiales bacterium]|nr:type II toxin-antitoxin system VapC family toxin [Acidimicrobiales bacterium]
MIVVDASALVDLFLEFPLNQALLDRLERADELHAPHLIDVELLSVLRRLVAADKLSLEAASMARAQFEDLGIERYSHVPLRARIWGLRGSLTAYDAAYVALSEWLGLPLVTSDFRLARSSGHAATIESFARRP